MTDEEDTLTDRQADQTVSGVADAVDPALFREVLGHYPTGVVLVTGIADDGEPIGMIVGTFTSVSIDPVLVAFLPTRSSRTFQRLRTAPSFCANVLAADQVEIARLFAGRSTEKFSQVSWRPPAARQQIRPTWATSSS